MAHPLCIYIISRTFIFPSRYRKASHLMIIIIIFIISLLSVNHLVMILVEDLDGNKNNTNNNIVLL